MTSGSPRSGLVLGARRSELARRQARRVADALRDAWPGLEVETRWITTEGDRVLDVPLPEIGGKGLFTAELEAALLGEEVDGAVHSLKDLPTDLGARFAVAGVPEREDPRDVLLGPDGPMSPAELGEGAVVGTSSLRRRAQLLARRPDCRVETVRGNVGTRVDKMKAGEYDALLLAAAGLLRLELVGPEDGPFLDPPGWLPAPGQGALGVEARADDGATRELLERVEEEGVRACVTAERAVLARLEAGCTVPIGALGRVGEDGLRLDAAVLSPDGGQELRAKGRAPLDDAARLGRSVAEDLLGQGAGAILASLEERSP